MSALPPKVEVKSFTQLPRFHSRNVGPDRHSGERADGRRWKSREGRLERQKPGDVMRCLWTGLPAIS